MTFWGVKVNPGKPFSHNCCDTRHRLHLSQATLDLGLVTKKVSVQCNVGKRSPVLLCSLLPDKWESCPLSLEFQESDDVTFSVIGPRSVYLTGYYVDVDSRSHTNADSESFGEDIVHTDCEKSLRSTDEDDYEDSFINDGDPDVLSSSSLSTGKDDPKPKIRKEKLKRLRKCTLNVSGDDDNSYNEICNTSVQTLSGTISDLKADIEQNIEEITVLPESNNMGVGEAAGSDDKMEELSRNEVNASVEDDKSREDPVPAAKVVPGSGKRKRRKNRGGDKFQGCQNMPALIPGEMDSILNSKHGTVSNRKSRRNHNTEGEDISETEKVREKFTHEMDNAREKITPGPECKSHVSEMLCDNQERPKKRKKHSHENGNSDILEVHTISKGDVKVIKSKDTHPVDEECNNSSLDKGIHPEGGRGELSKKKKTKIESSEVEVTVCGMVVSPTTKEKNRTLNNTTTKSADITIEEIEVGDAGGKIASLGKKVRIHYVGRLRGDEQIIHSSVEQAPFKFRLGGGAVIEGWNVGVEGMRVGGKRKLIIPPSMAYGSEGDGGKIPPDSWLEYDVELVRVH